MSTTIIDHCDLAAYRSNLQDNGTPSAVPNYVLAPTIQCYDCHDAHVPVVRVNDSPPFIRALRDIVLSASREGSREREVAS